MAREVFCSVGKRATERGLAAAVFLVAWAAQAVAPLSGTWEMQTMGADREVTVEHDGAKLAAHRIMWPSFEGEKYKLEHLYRGTISGTKIAGELLVREEELPDFEVLRKFEGSISGDKLVIDGIVLKRTGSQKTPVSFKQASATAEAATEPVSPTRPAQQTTTSSQPPPSEEPAAAAKREQSEADEAMSLFNNIMGTPGAGRDSLIKVSNTIQMPGENTGLIAAGDQLFAAGKYEMALKKYEAAGEIAGTRNVGLLHRQGRCFLRLKRHKQAKKLLRRALKLDPENKQLQRDYSAAKTLK